MNKPRLSMYLLMYLSLTIGCGVFSGAKMSNMVDLNEIKQITYRFIDGSVPPQYHRSYTITVTADKADIVVDSYGKVLADKNYEIKQHQFKNLLDLFEKSKIRNCRLRKEDGCTGGTGEKISLSNGKEDVFNGRVYHCAGRDYGDLCGDISAFASGVKELVPDLDELAK